MRSRATRAALVAAGLLVFGLAFGNGVYGNESESRESIRVMSFNIRCPSLEDGFDFWWFRKDEVARYILRHSPDLAGMQEVYPFQARYLEKQLVGYEWFGLPPDVREHLGERCKVFYRKERLEVLDSFTIDVLRPMVVLLNWDGVPRVLRDNPDYFREFLDVNDPNKMDDLAGIMGGPNVDNGVEIPNMFCTLPSSTFASHASIYTGLPPGEHHIVNNSYYDRVKEDKVMSFSGDVITLLTLLTDHGPLDEYIKDKGTLYSDLTGEGYKSMVIGHSLKYGKTDYILPVENALENDEKIQQWLDNHEMELTTLAPAYCGIAAHKCDEKAYEFARTKVLGKGKHYDLMTIYTWDTDHSPHSKGTSYLDGYLPQVDDWINDLWTYIDDNGLGKNTVFVLFDDHGRVSVDPQSVVTATYLDP